MLVVDDESDLELLIKQKFRRKIREGSYEVLLCALTGPRPFRCCNKKLILTWY
jgi:hypothetical protein